MTKHPQIEVPNLHVCKLMQSLCSREVVKEKFNWCETNSDNRAGHACARRRSQAETAIGAGVRERASERSQARLSTTAA